MEAVIITISGAELCCSELLMTESPWRWPVSKKIRPLRWATLHYTPVLPIDLMKIVWLVSRMILPYSHASKLTQHNSVIRIGQKSPALLCETWKCFINVVWDKQWMKMTKKEEIEKYSTIALYIYRILKKSPSKCYIRRLVFCTILFTVCIITKKIIKTLLTSCFKGSISVTDAGRSDI